MAPVTRDAATASRRARAFPATTGEARKNPLCARLDPGVGRGARRGGNPRRVDAVATRRAVNAMSAQTMRTYAAHTAASMRPQSPSRRALRPRSLGMSRRVSVRFRVGSGARIGATRRYHRAFSAAVDITPGRLMFLRRRRARPSRDAPAPRADRRGILVFPLLGFSPAVPQPRIDSYPTTPPSLALVNSLPERRSPPPPRA